MGTPLHRLSTNLAKYEEFWRNEVEGRGWGNGNEEEEFTARSSDGGHRQARTILKARLLRLNYLKTEKLDFSSGRKATQNLLSWRVRIKSSGDKPQIFLYSPGPIPPSEKKQVQKFSS